LKGRGHGHAPTPHIHWNDADLSDGTALAQTDKHKKKYRREPQKASFFFGRLCSMQRMRQDQEKPPKNPRRAVLRPSKKEDSLCCMEKANEKNKQKASNLEWQAPDAPAGRRFAG
jgi:hypothetical protein